MKISHSARWVLAGLAVVLPLSPGRAGGASAPPEKLKVGFVAVTPGQAGLFMAQDAGLFRAEGLEVELVFFTSGTEALQTIVSGQLALCSGAGGPPLVNAVLAGARVVWIAELLGTMPYTLVVSPAIRQPADLKGKRLGINRFGASPDFATRYAARKLGLDPEKDVTILQVGSQSERLAALQAGAIDGTVLSPPGTIVLRKLGFRELTDLARLGLRYPFETVAVSRAFLAERPETLRKFLRAVVRGTHRFKTHREEGIRTLARYLKMDDRDALDEAYAFFAPLILERPYVPPEGVEMILREIARENAAATRASPAQFLDMRFVRELEDEGLFDRLYGARPGARP